MTSAGVHLSWKQQERSTVRYQRLTMSTTLKSAKGLHFSSGYISMTVHLHLLPSRRINYFHTLTPDGSHRRKSN
uniref:Uncharacterized protein n=1 Tax=Anguilla anguilla TaxID=7936 RepID=A0A0E9WCG7_ANGAN